jgi:predicted tellurium resistance membrane protein TerC
MLELLTDPSAWISLAVLTLMEVILGIDNIVFISILTARLPRHQQVLGRRLGLAGALLTRIALLMTINWLAHLQDELFTLWRPWTGKDLVLLAGGLFLLWKATREIYESVEHPHDQEHNLSEGANRMGLAWVVAQITLLDIVFSIDSVITAVGMADHLEVMVLAILIAIAVMMLFAGPVGDFVQNNPSIKVLALAFLVLIGATLVMEGTGQHVAKGYVYSAMGFSLLVQVLNLRMHRKAEKLAPQGAPTTHAPVGTDTPDRE